MSLLYLLILPKLIAFTKQIVSSLVKAKATSSNLREKNLDFASIAAQTEGYLPADLRDLVDRSIHQAAMRSSPDSIVRFSPPLG